MEPDYTRLGARLAERAAPLQPPDVDVQYGYAFGNLCEAMMRCYEQIASLVDPEDETYPPWGVLFDVDVCPAWALPWLAQVVGVRLPKSVTGDAAREYIKTLSFESVGRPDTIKTIVTAPLTGSKTVFFRERDDGDAYRLEIVTLTSETPDPAELQRAIESSVPAGIIVAYRAIAGWDYQQMTTEGGKYLLLPPRFDNYQNMSENDRS
jgi:hypothetical protein